MPLLAPEFLTRLDQLRLITRNRANGRLPGSRPTRRTGSSLELADYREYQPGDDLRYVDWHAYQRLGRLFVKLWVAEQDLVVTLVVDASASMAFGRPSKLERAKELAAACGYVALTGGDPVQLMVLAGEAGGTGEPVSTAAATAAATATATATATTTPSPRFWPQLRGRAEAMELFGRLEQVQAGGRADWERAVASLSSTLSTTGAGGLTLWFSDGLDPAGPAATTRALRSLFARGQEVIFVQVLSPAELQPEWQGEYRLLDSEGGPGVELALTRSVLRVYQDELAAWLGEIQSACRSLGVDHLLVNTAWSSEQTIWQGLQSIRRLQVRAH